MTFSVSCLKQNLLCLSILTLSSLSNCQQINRNYHYPSNFEMFGNYQNSNIMNPNFYTTTSNPAFIEQNRIRSAASLHLPSYGIQSTRHPIVEHINENIHETIVLNGLRHPRESLPPLIGSELHRSVGSSEFEVATVSDNESESSQSSSIPISIEFGYTKGTSESDDTSEVITSSDNGHKQTRGHNGKFNRTSHQIGNNTSKTNLSDIDSLLDQNSTIITSSLNDTLSDIDSQHSRSHQNHNNSFGNATGKTSHNVNSSYFDHPAHSSTSQSPLFGHGAKASSLSSTAVLAHIISSSTGAASSSTGESVIANLPSPTASSQVTLDAFNTFNILICAILFFQTF